MKLSCGDVIGTRSCSLRSSLQGRKFVLRHYPTHFTDAVRQSQFYIGYIALVIEFGEGLLENVVEMTCLLCALLSAKCFHVSRSYGAIQTTRLGLKILLCLMALQTWYKNSYCARRLRSRSSIEGVLDVQERRLLTSVRAAMVSLDAGHSIMTSAKGVVPMRGKCGPQRPYLAIVPEGDRGGRN